jgi:hypothetical protein
MLEAQVVVDLLLESEVRVDFVGHGIGSVNAQVWRGTVTATK